MKVGDQRSHLILVESAGKAWHHTPTLQHILLDGFVSRRSTAGQGLLVENPVEIGWNLLEGEVIVLMAVRASPLVEMLPSLLLGSEFRYCTATEIEKGNRHNKDRAQPSSGKQYRRMGCPEPLLEKQKLPTFKLSPQTSH